MKWSILGTLWFSVSQNIAIRWLNTQNYTLNASGLVMATEICKIAIASAVCVGWLKKPAFPRPIRWGFVVNSALYTITNVLTYSILAEIDVGLYTVLAQHKILLVMGLSSVFFARTYTPVQWGSSLILMAGIMLTQAEKVSTTNAPNLGALALIFVQGLCSSFSSIWIEKMMKRTEENDNMFYTFLTDSIQMYAFGLPFYAVLFYASTAQHTLPPGPSTALVVNGALCGIFIGSIFKYYSATLRTFVQGMTVVICFAADIILFSKQLKISEFVGAFCVLAGNLIFVFGKKL